MHEYRTHSCNELRLEHQGEVIRLAGWIQTTRDHGGVVFADIRDHYGVTQVVVPPEQAELQEHLRSLPRESVVRVSGAVA